MKTAYPLLAVLLSGIVLVSGCTSQSPPPAGAPDQQGQSQPQAQGQPTEGQPQNQGAQGGSSLKDLVGKGISYTADYDITAAGKTEAITQLFAPPKYAMVTKSGGTEARTIFDGTSLIVCSQNEGSWTCMKTSQQKPPASQDTANQVNEGATINNVGSCSRAGESGAKYEVVYKGASSKVCYTNDGIMLETEAEGATIYATRVARSVDSSLLVPPAEPRDLSGISGGLTGLPGQ